eukprot:5752936-Amphidinium_carterae.1
MVLVVGIVFSARAKEREWTKMSENMEDAVMSVLLSFQIVQAGRSRKDSNTSPPNSAKTQKKKKHTKE